MMTAGGAAWLDAAESFKAVHSREPDVEKNDVKTTVRSALQGSLGRLGGFRDVAFVGEDGRQGFADTSFVVNDQNVWFGWHRVGQSTFNAKLR